MKIGILTFHCAHNYGAVLQAYATQEFIRNLGHQAYVINYRPRYLIDTYKIIKKQNFISDTAFKTIKRSTGEILTIGKRIYRYCGFNHFIKSKLFLLQLDNNQIPTDLDVYILGSDQIWNPKITFGFDGTFFGDFVKDKSSKVIAYAASMEAIDLTKESEEYLKKKINALSAISVRESELLKLLQPISNKRIELVLDPTLLIERTLFDKITKTPKLRKKYVLVYQVRHSEETLRIANEIASQLGCVVVQLVAFLDRRNIKYRYQCTSPNEFIGWHKNAECIVTTSFHSSAFSIIYNKPFYTIKLNDGADSRLSSLLSSLCLDSRFINSSDHPEFCNIDYSVPNRKLEKLRAHSSNFLRSSISN